MDSATLLHHVAKTLGHAPVHALSFSYGQRHARELECAAWQAAASGVAEHRVVDISFMADLVREGTSLVEGGSAVPDLNDVPEDARSQPPTYVPNRNMVLLSVAAAYAEASGLHDLFYGAQAHDKYGYWDCTPEFLEAINVVLTQNRNQPVRIHAPPTGRRKAEIIPMGQALGVDFTHTWSCYRGAEQACGTCPTCVERLNAWQQAGQPDPIPYAKL
jgi:7-cyano-7-deazaguanine synthase